MLQKAVALGSCSFDSGSGETTAMSRLLLPQIEYWDVTELLYQDDEKVRHLENKLCSCRSSEPLYRALA